jgi:magnesium transporter
VFIALHEIELDRIADQLERLQSDLASHGTELIERHPRSADFERSSAELIRIQNVSGLVRLSLIDIERLLSYLRRQAEVSSEHAHRVREMLRDIESLAAHTSFVLEKVSFLSSSIMGRIGLQENHIIRVLSIAAGVFLPPTLIASVYGMNFRVMPELRWPFGYPLAGVLMLLSALLPLWYFKRQHWL